MAALACRGYGDTTDMDLIVCFDEPFWVALVVVDDDEGAAVHRHVFGPSEPSGADVVAFARSGLHGLLRSRPAARLPRRDLTLPPTRAARLRAARDAVERSPFTPELVAAIAGARRAGRVDARSEAREQAAAAQARERALERERRREHHRHG